jgi:predicted nucleic acid-binding protein
VNILIDSDIAIEILRGRNHTILSAWHALADSEASIFYSPVTSAEVWGGAFAEEFPLVMRFFRPLICLPPDYETSYHAGDLLRRYRKSHNLEVPDAMIAATAIQHHAALWTRNRKHYPMPQITFYS